MSAVDSRDSRAFTRRILDGQPDGEMTLLDLAHELANICPAGERAVGRYIREAGADPVDIVAELRAALDAPMGEDERTSNTVRLPEGRIARRYRIRLTNTVIHTIYEPTTLALDAPQGSRHGTITHINEVCVGRLVSRDLPPELQALPVGETRSLAVRAHHQAGYAESERLLRQAFPYLVEAPVSWIDGDGEVPVTWINGDAEVHNAALAERTDRIDHEQA